MKDAASHNISDFITQNYGFMDFDIDYLYICMSVLIILYMYIYLRVQGAW
jgi:hypothetical protein